MTMTKFTSLVILLGVTTLALSDEECGGSMSTTLHTDLVKSTNYYCRCTFPTYKLNVGCLLSSCPNLKDVCPLTSTKSVNPTALSKAVSVLNACIGQNAPICSTNMTSISMVPLGWATTQILPITMVNGSCWLNTGAGYLNGMSSAQYSVSPTYSSNGLINLSIRTDKIVNSANYNCTFNLPDNSVLNLLPLSLNTENLLCLMYFNISITVSIDITTTPPTIKTLADNSKYTIDFADLITPQGASLPSDISKMLSEAVNKLIQETEVTSSATNMLSTLAALSLQAAQQSCP